MRFGPRYWDTLGLDLGIENVAVTAIGTFWNGADEGNGPGLGKGDAVIAATALERDESVLAADSHFATIPDVSVETYR